ncbi:MAG TPA: SRPBCC family protein [Urbifossiella sp.]|jgi:hypothetical protein|nr:SRPBCC family protein [Urbifossiella sp.]
MWEHSLVTTTDVPAADLWAVAADARNWPAWRPGVEAAEVAADAHQVRVRNHGRWSRLAVEEADPPARLVLAAGGLSGLLAHTRTVFAFTTIPAGTVVRVGVEVHGPLGLYHAAINDGDDADLLALVRALVSRARAGRDAPTDHPVAG